MIWNGIPELSENVENCDVIIEVNQIKITIVRERIMPMKKI